MIYLISDHHFGHKNIISLEGRPFKDIDAMERVMISRWNQVVKKDDIVWHVKYVCDLCGRTRDTHELYAYRPKGFEDTGTRFYNITITPVPQRIEFLSTRTIHIENEPVHICITCICRVKGEYFPALHTAPDTGE